ncbi:hypothetical protein H6G97_45735 [Nostoc flagelliforme FACHB-838]|uniref:Uncharacterized protein n=1 Tax=Nostoc flagelliforme FACHB-838 TaxID=2692904 RepID=A0ABR8E3X0_9NOSO|nr:hypothetical protein [Nostoc flagelliforme FACHB-838]
MRTLINFFATTPHTLHPTPKSRDEYWICRYLSAIPDYPFIAIVDCGGSVPRSSNGGDRQLTYLLK